MNRVVHFEIPADDIDRAQRFYTETFGWKINAMPEMKYTILQTTELDENRMPKEPGAINGGMGKRGDYFQSPTITIDVDDIDEALKKIEAVGGEKVREKMAVGDMGFTAYFRDTENNLIGLWETKK